MTYKELKKELCEDCYTADDIGRWWKLRKDQISKLSFKKANKLMQIASLEIACDYNCV